MGTFFPGWPRRAAIVVLLAAGLCGGCASLTNPVADGVPVRRVPEELLTPSRKDFCTIPLQLLQGPPTDVYRLSSGDVLAVYVEGFLGAVNQAIPVNVGGLVQARDQRRQNASTGYPVPVTQGAVNLPGVGQVPVEGLSIPEAREAIRRRYVAGKLLNEDNANILVDLLQPRQSSVVVLRQEAASFTTGPNGVLIASKRGVGTEIDLPAYENDVLHALARTGGLPGIDACNEVVIQKRCFAGPAERAQILARLGRTPASVNPLEVLNLPGPIIRIPLRLPAGRMPVVKPCDVILETGDIVFLEAAEHNVFYTGGLLPPGEYQLPRDRDMDVLEAVTFVRGSLINGAFGGSNLSGTLLQQGIGNPSPTQLTVVRRTPGGGQVPIIVDLGVALNDSRERILIKPGDLLILQEKPGEALARYFSQTFVNFNLVWDVVNTPTAAGILDISAAERLPRLPNVNFNKP